MCVYTYIYIYISISLSLYIYIYTHTSGQQQHVWMFKTKHDRYNLTSHPCKLPRTPRIGTTNIPRTNTYFSHTQHTTLYYAILYYTPIPHPKLYFSLPTFRKPCSLLLLLLIIIKILS